jgi:hypothetical protein
MFEKLINLYIAYLYVVMGDLDKSELLKQSIRQQVMSFDFSDQTKVQELMSAIVETFGEDKVKAFMESSSEEDTTEADSNSIDFITPADFKDLRREITKAPIHSSGIKAAHSLSKYLEARLLVDELPRIAYDEEKIILDWETLTTSVSIVVDSETVSLIYDDGEDATEVVRAFDEMDDESYELMFSVITGVTCGNYN